jgi:hypothetical protein
MASRDLDPISFGRKPVWAKNHLAENWLKMAEWTSIRTRSFRPTRPILYHNKLDLFHPRLHALSHTSFLLQKGKILRSKNSSSKNSMKNVVKLLFDKVSNVRNWLNLNYTDDTTIY